MPRALWILAACLFVLMAPQPATACAPAPRQGEAVRIADEEALIAWDAKKKMEHFVRRASFKSSGDAFGFLVPTPSKPELGEVDNRIFYDLAQNLVPRVVYEDGDLSLGVGCSALMFLGRYEKSASAPSLAAAAAPAVRVLDEQRVAGYDAVVLAADDPAALSAWLKEKGFAEGPALTEWLAPYVASKWIITAFKVADSAPAAGTPGAARAIGTSAVLMSFTTSARSIPTVSRAISVRRSRPRTRSSPSITGCCASTSPRTKNTKACSATANRSRARPSSPTSSTCHPRRRSSWATGRS